MILKQAHRINLDRLQHWLLQRQMRVEGGFQGRTNKLVDSCYSFWQGSAVALVQIIRRGGTHVTDMQDLLAAAGAGEEEGRRRRGGEGQGGQEGAVGLVRSE